jgi:TRAP-type C4-dicarboxylate transport system permease small subunit
MPDHESGTDTGHQSGAARWATGLVELVGGIAIFLLMLMTVSDALLRSFANRPILGGNDLVQVMLVVVVACAVPLCIAGGRAIAIEFLVARLPSRIGGMIGRAMSTIAAVALGYLAWRCWVNAGEAARFGETTMLLQIPFGPFYLALAISFAVSAGLFAFFALSGKSAS